MRKSVTFPALKRIFEQAIQARANTPVAGAKTATPENFWWMKTFFARNGKLILTRASFV
jgi:hypothetical protein